MKKPINSMFREIEIGVLIIVISALMIQLGSFAPKVIKVVSDYPNFVVAQEQRDSAMVKSITDLTNNVTDLTATVNVMAYAMNIKVVNSKQHIYSINNKQVLIDPENGKTKIIILKPNEIVGK